MKKRRTPELIEISKLNRLIHKLRNSQSLRKVKLGLILQLMSTIPITLEELLAIEVKDCRVDSLEITEINLPNRVISIPTTLYQDIRTISRETGFLFPAERRKRQSLTLGKMKQDCFYRSIRNAVLKTMPELEAKVKPRILKASLICSLLSDYRVSIEDVSNVCGISVVTLQRTYLPLTLSSKRKKSIRGMGLGA